MAEKGRRRTVLIEILVVLSLFVLPNLVAGIVGYLDPARFHWTYAAASLIRIEQAVSIVPAVIFIAWRSGKGLGKFGLGGFVWWEGGALALAVLFALMMVPVVIHRFFYTFAPDLAKESAAQLKLVNSLRPRLLIDYPLMVVSKIMGATSEEFIMRGYLITRLRSLGPNVLVSSLISAALFASYHIYEGPVAVVGVFVMGLIFTIPFLATKSIWPGVAAHSAYNMFVELTRL